MQYLSIDYLIVYAFLAITLLIGLWSGRGIQDVRDYVLANKSFGTGALTLTFLATHIGSGSIFDGIGFMFSFGVLEFLTLCSISIAYLVQAFFVAPKAASFTDCLTMGDLMETFYDTNSKIIAGILGLVMSIIIAAMELIFLGVIGEKILNIPAQWTIIIGGVLLAIYSAHGGIKSVTVTDVFQFLVFIIGIPAIAYFILDQAGGIRAVLTHIPPSRFMITSHEKFPMYLNLFLLWAIFPAGMICPAIIQRFLMAKTGQQLRNQYLLAAGFEPAFQAILLVIAFSALILFPHLEAQQVVPHICSTLLPVGLKGLAIASLLSIGLSSIDSQLHAAGFTFVHDVMQPLTKQRYVVNELRWMRYATVGVSLVSIAIALNMNDTLELLMHSFACTGPVLMFPFFAGLMGLKTDKRSFYVALWVTLVTFGGCKFFLPEKLSDFTTIISITVNGIIFFGTHIYVNKGFAVAQRTKEKKVVVFRPTRKNFLSIFASLIPTPQAIVRYSQATVRTYGAPYVLFGVFFTLNLIVPYFLWPTDALPYNGNILLLRTIGGIFCGLLIVKEKWPAKLLPYMPIFWHITVMYCLPFMGTIMLLFTGASIEWAVHIIAIIILLFLLVDWVTAIIISLLGVFLGYITYVSFFGIPVMSISFINMYLMIYQCIFGMLIGLLFARRRQLRYDRLATQNQTLITTEEESRQSYLTTLKEKIRLIRTLKNADIQQLATAVKDLKFVRSHTTAPVSDFNKNLQGIEDKVAAVALALTNVAYRAMDYVQLEIKSITIPQLLKKLQKRLPNATLHYIGKMTQHAITCDPIQLVKVFKNTIAILPNNADAPHHKDYYVTIQDTFLTYPFPTVSALGNYVKSVPAIQLVIGQQADQLPEVANKYTPNMSTSTVPNPTNVRELLLTENQRIIKAHYGYTNLDVSQQNTYNHYIYVVPVDLNQIRPPDTNTPNKEWGSELVRANDQYPGAQEQEHAFLKAVKQKSSAHIDNVKKALELIKWYHGSVHRRSGEPYYLHSLAVAHIVLEWTQEEATIIGALLHDTVEDTSMLLENIDMMFGADVVRVVDYVTRFESFQNSFYRGNLNDTENKRMLLEATDIQALYVKVADRMHNMRTIEAHPTEEKKKKISQETLEFFVPLARYLRLEQAAQELLDMSTHILDR